MTATTGPVKIDRASTDYKFVTARDRHRGLLPGADATRNINAELTTTVHCGFAKFTFPATSSPHSPASQLHQQPHYFESCPLHRQPDCHGRCHERVIQRRA